MNQLTIRHLKENKKRTLVTIIGVIISMAMITAVATLVVSFMDVMQRQAISDDGEWHVLYENVNSEQIDAIQLDKETEEVILSRDRGYALVEGVDTPNKPFLFIKEYNAEGFENFPIELSQGELPQSENEIVISEEVVTHGKVDYKIGDTLSLNIGTRNANSPDINRPLNQNFPLQKDEGKVLETLEPVETREYKIVGFIKRPNFEPTWAPGYTALSYVEQDLLGENEQANAAVILKKVNRSLYDHAWELADSQNIEPVSFNNRLLRYYGVTSDQQLQKTLYSLSAIIIVIIVIGSVALIYNAFAISVSERARHLGMLSSVGATKRQKRNSVFFEGIVIGLISIPIGLGFGLLGIQITFLFINSIIQGALGLTEKFQVVVTPLSVLLAVIISFVTIMFSTYLPARKASKISAIDAIRQTQDVKLSRRKVKTSKWIRKIFGFEAEIGLKNLKRNKRRYQITIFSLVISILLFLVVSFFTDSLKKGLELSQDGVNFDIQITAFDQEEVTDNQIQSILSLPDVTEDSVYQSMYLSSWVGEKYLPEPLQEMVENVPSHLENGKFMYSIEMYSFEEKYLEKLIRDSEVDIKELTNSNQWAGLAINNISYQDRNAKKYVETRAIEKEVGESINLTLDEENQQEQEIKIVGFLEEAPMGIMAYNVGSLTLIVSNEVMEELIKKNPALAERQRTYIYLKSLDPMKTQREIEEINSGLSVYNVYEARQREQQLVLLMSVFTYGFIVLITAISIANIFNTISTSVSLRKRELAMLRAVGMTPKSFSRMMNYESIFYGLKSLTYGLPLSFGVMYLIHRSMMNSFDYGFSIPWMSVGYVILAIFIIVGSSMLYAMSKVRKENIIDALKQENI